MALIWCITHGPRSKKSLKKWTLEIQKFHLFDSREFPGIVKDSREFPDSREFKESGKYNITN